MNRWLASSIESMIVSSSSKRPELNRSDENKKSIVYNYVGEIFFLYGTGWVVSTNVLYDFKRYNSKGGKWGWYEQLYFHFHFNYNSFSWFADLKVIFLIGIEKALAFNSLSLHWCFKALNTNCDQNIKNGKERKRSLIETCMCGCECKIKRRKRIIIEYLCFLKTKSK